MYDNVLYGNKDLQNLCNVLDKGMKFVPNFINNDYTYFKYILSEIDSSLLRFNGSVFFNKVNLDKENDSDEPETVIINENKKLNLKRYRSIDYSKFQLQKESIDFRLNLIDKLSDDFFNRNTELKDNMSKDELKSLIDFKQKKPFKILQCDKNVGIILMNHVNHEQLAKDHLDNTSKL